MTEAGPVAPQSLEKGYETSDVGARWVGVAAAGLAISMIGLAALMGGYVALFDRHQAADSGLTKIERTDLTPPKPRLEPDSEGDARAINQSADRRLTEFGWTDRADNIAHIPVDEAMRLLAQRGWPSQERSQP
jgi:hypothetical protein